MYRKCQDSVVVILSDGEASTLEPKLLIIRVEMHRYVVNICQLRRCKCENSLARVSGSR